MDEKKKQEILKSSYLSTDEGKNYLYHQNKNKITRIDDPSNYNQLTGLPILRLFYYEAGEIIVNNPEKLYSVIVMDITQFKAVNEFLGRQEGDRLLKIIGDILMEFSRTRPYTAVCQVRADNFCLMTAYSERVELEDLAREIKRRVEEAFVAFRVILSIGICASTEEKPSVSFMKDCATIALSTIKGKYFADFCFFEESMRTSMLSEKLVESYMVEALAKGHIVPYIQPKVDMITEKIVGGEALARWLDPHRGVVSPGLFIPVIEKTGLVIDVDKKIWEQAFAYQRRVLDEGRTPVPLSVNISRMHTYDRHLVEIITSLEDRFRVDPLYVVLELTESVFSSQDDEITRSMKELRSRGYLISMDDFGSGYSSLNMLMTQEIDEVKLDKEFLADISDMRSRIVLKHLLTMLNELRVKIISEGVETGEQRDFLIRNGCRRCQGFFYHRPMPVDEFDRLLKQQEEE